MQINYRQYPHPVLSYFADDVIDSDFQASLKSSKTQNSYIFEAQCITSSDGINKLLNEKKACYAFHFECSTTRYRKVFRSFDSSFTFQLPADTIEGKVQICSFILASENMDHYFLAEFHPDYEGHTFSIKKGDVLAIDAERTFFAEKEYDPLRRIPSIFTVQPTRGENAMPFDMDSSGHKIIIKLSEDNFEYYKTISLNQNLQSLLSSLIIMPALVSILETLKNAVDQEFDLEECRWYRVIKSRLKELGIDIDNKSTFSDSTLAVAQKLIGEPLNSSLLALINFDDEE
ncbi:hypothetical protein [Paenibacillus xerothermodurans]|uniref:Uncharacterized protein n=1 Tax=Paenibacillus xerothermodurans TaxID=1977292 RepID=A0A2W1NMX5_PAEXE|nr:hypothetical protein [Paenibacillus xerothermodurans]PZE20323.1 hypothetical protein CBW46_014355 [Paenibacillus xerothermodurans]